MTSVFSFGERIDGYPIPVLNERAVRAAAGLLFVFAMTAFMNAWLLGNFQPTRIFVVAFLLDFSIRIFVNPSYSPSLIIGRWMVRKQQPEWTGAAQKRFAWIIGFGLAVTVLYLVVIKGVIGPVNLIVCAICLTLLFFESAFGICIGCKIYNLLNRQSAQLCPGGTCEYRPGAGVGGDWKHAVSLAAFLSVIGGWIHYASDSTANTTSNARANIKATSNAESSGEAKRCKVPDFAKGMGHEEMWKLHNNCK